MSGLGQATLDELAEAGGVQVSRVRLTNEAGMSFELDLGPAPSVTIANDDPYDQGDLALTGGNLYIYIDGVEHGSIWFHIGTDGRPRVTLGQFDREQEWWVARSTVAATEYETDTPSAPADGKP